jgi:hypothetical protein
MILEMYSTAENFFAFRIRVKDDVVGVKKPKVLTLNMLPYFTRSTETKDSRLI